MNARMFGKLIIVLVILLFMVMMGMENDSNIEFRLAGKELGDVRAAIMYFIFLGAGVVLGAVLATGWRGAGK